MVAVYGCVADLFSRWLLSILDTDFNDIESGESRPSSAFFLQFLNINRHRPQTILTQIIQAEPSKVNLLKIK